MKKKIKCRNFCGRKFGGSKPKFLVPHNSLHLHLLPKKHHYNSHWIVKQNHKRTTIKRRWFCNEIWEVKIRFSQSDVIVIVWSATRTFAFRTIADKSQHLNVLIIGIAKLSTLTFCQKLNYWFEQSTTPMTSTVRSAADVLKFLSHLSIILSGASICQPIGQQRLTRWLRFAQLNEKNSRNE